MIPTRHRSQALSAFSSRPKTMADTLVVAIHYEAAKEAYGKDVNKVTGVINWNRW